MAATALKVFRVLSSTIVNMTLPLSDVLMCSSGVVVNYTTDSEASTLWEENANGPGFLLDSVGYVARELRFGPEVVPRVPRAGRLLRKSRTLVRLRGRS